MVLGGRGPCIGGADREDLGRLKSEELLSGVLVTTDSGADMWGLGTVQGSARRPRPLDRPLTFHLAAGTGSGSTLQQSRG